jgi:hypothetical protein
MSGTKGMVHYELLVKKEAVKIFLSVSKHTLD